MADEVMMKPETVAEFLVVSVRTLERWREQGRGPRWSRVGGQIRYRRTDVEAWLVEREGVSS